MPLATVTLCARNAAQLETARKEIEQATNIKERINTVSVDLSIASQVCFLRARKFRFRLTDSTAHVKQTEEVFRSLDQLPDTLYCVAGGAIVENGFLVDIGPGDLESCMRNNYFTSAFAAQAMLKLWFEDDSKVQGSRSANTATRTQRRRRIVFVSSVAAFVGLPGYAAYTRTWTYPPGHIYSGAILTSLLLSLQPQKQPFERWRTPYDARYSSIPQSRPRLHTPSIAPFPQTS